MRRRSLISIPDAGALNAGSSGATPLMIARGAVRPRPRSLTSMPRDRVRAENARAIEAEPERLIALLTHEKAVFDDRDVARALFRSVDDPDQFERIRLTVT